LSPGCRRYADDAGISRISRKSRKPGIRRKARLVRDDRRPRSEESCTGIEYLGRYLWGLDLCSLTVVLSESAKNCRRAKGECN
jgi:hypothetical protein